MCQRMRRLRGRRRSAVPYLRLWLEAAFALGGLRCTRLGCARLERVRLCVVGAAVAAGMRGGRFSRNIAWSFNRGRAQALLAAGFAISRRFVLASTVRAGSDSRFAGATATAASATPTATATALATFPCALGALGTGAGRSAFRRLSSGFGSARRSRLCFARPLARPVVSAGSLAISLAFAGRFAAAAALVLASCFTLGRLFATPLCLTARACVLVLAARATSVAIAVPAAPALPFMPPRSRRCGRCRLDRSLIAEEPALQPGNHADCGLAL